MEHMARDKKSVVAVFVEMVLMVCKMVADGTRVAFATMDTVGKSEW